VANPVIIVPQDAEAVPRKFSILLNSLLVPSTIIGVVAGIKTLKVMFIFINPTILRQMQKGKFPNTALSGSKLTISLCQMAG